MKRLCLSIVPLLLIALTLPGLAQTVTGTIRGTITDPSGAIVPNAKITITNSATGVQTSAITNQSGEYSIRFLQIGQYKLIVQAQGFEQATYGPFSLEIDQVAKIDIPLQVGSASTSVEVTEQFQPILDTENATLGETFTENTIHNVPLNGLDFSQLTVYTPGAVSTGFNSYGGNNSMERSTNAGNEVSVNGNRQQSNNYLLDGQEINENINNTLGYGPSPEALEQVRVIAANPNAEFGNVNGGTVIAAMKSGSNSWHGSIFGYLKDYKLDANSWGNDNNVVPLPKNPYTTTQFGGTFGGPIFHDKLFFFIDYLGFRNHTAGVTTATVATQAMRNGDLSNLEAIGVQLYDTTNINPVTGQPTPYLNNQIPINNPVAQYLFSNTAAYPLPNNAPNPKDPSGIYNNFVGPSGSFATNDQGDAKVDWHFGSRDIMAFRYSQGYAADGTTADPLPVQFPSASNYPDHFFDANWVHTFSPAIVNSFTASYGRIRFNSGVTVDPSGIFGLNGNNLVGIPSKPQLVAGFSAQNFSTQSANGAPSNFGANPTPEIFIDNIFGYSDNLTWQKGKHLLKFGGEFLRYQQNSFYPGNDGELGAFAYSGVYSSNPYGSGAQSAFADFILERANDVQIGDVTGRTGQRQWRDGIYAQDDWKIRPNLTINLGLRWEFDQPIYEVNNKQANLNLQTGQIVYAGVDGNSRALYDPVYTQFQPRVGFAYQATNRFVVRGGYGISSYLEGTGANLRLTQNPPFHTDFEQIGTSPSKGGDGSAYSPGVFFQTSNGFPTTSLPITTFYAWPKNLKAAMTQEFSLTTEYQVARNSTFQVGYIGILGHHLTDPFWGNQDPAPGVDGPYDSVVGEGGVLKITQTESASNYNALQAVFRQRLTNGLELTANYTFSKSLTDDIGFYGVSNIGSGQYYQQNAYDMRSEWGPSGMDTHHNISVTGVYDLPFGRGRMFGSNMNAVVNEVVGGWRLGGADVYYSGFPITVSSPANYSSTVHAFTGAARPNLLRPFHATNKSINAYFGTAVQTDSCGPDQDDGSCIFQQQSDSAFGALRPGALRGPSFQNIDMSVSKTFRVWHEQHLDFRADFFNAFNIADYSAPDSGMSDGASFGQITGTINNNRSTQLSLKYAF
jgi:Carboxypeptidase regulatory-like domain